MSSKARALIVGILLAIAVGYRMGYQAAPREILDGQVSSVGFFSVDEQSTLAVAVLSLQAEERLQVYSYKADVTVSAEHSTLMGLLSVEQQLSVPAAVSYYANFGSLTEKSIQLDSKTRVLTVVLAPLKLGDVAFQPEKAALYSGGMLSFSRAQTDSLQRLNYQQARRSLIKQAQQESLIEIAQAQATKVISGYFRFAFSLAGRPLKGVIVRFEDNPLT